MRVAIVTESFAPDVNGVAVSVARVAEHLLRRGHDPIVVAPRPAGARRVVDSYPYPVTRVPGDLAAAARASVAGRTWEVVGDELIGHYEAARGQARVATCKA